MLEGMPEGGTAFWVRTADGRRVRIASFDGQSAGTVLLFPGRTEYIEKYGHVITRLRAMGLNVACIDWCSHGLSDRTGATPDVGHVDDFNQYQTDLAAMLAHPAVKALPGPRFLLAHSMGGCIGLRALIEGLDVKAAIFCAPMWGLRVPPLLYPFAHFMVWAGMLLGKSKSFLPGTGAASYVTRQGFDGNNLTHDPDSYAMMRAHLSAKPALGLGGPSIGWVDAARRETVALRQMPAPDIPVLTFLGSDEAIVDANAVRKGSARLPQGELIECTPAHHEILMETPKVQEEVWAKIATFLAPMLSKVTN